MRRFEHEAFEACGGSPATTWRIPSFKLRLLGFAVAIAAVACLIVGFDTNIWRVQGRLREGFAAIKAEKFYFGVNFRMNMRKLTTSLLDYHLTGNTADLESFRNDAQQLKDWLNAKQMSFVATGERAAFTRLVSAYEQFLAEAERMLRARNAPQQAGHGFAAAYSTVRKDSQPVLKACEDVVGAEHGEFDVFLHNSDRALTSLQRLFLLSLLLLVALALAVAVLVFRGMIAPLRAQLTESQELIARQEKLAALGVLGAGVAHEIRNPLTAIKFRLFSLIESLPSGFAENEDARTISEELKRLDHIVRDFLQFARPSEPELMRVPAERILREVTDLIQSELKSSAIELKLEVVQTAWILADTHQLKQVLINLIQNSADSIGKNGTVTVRLATGNAAFATVLRPAAIIAVEDNGKGIPLDVQKRLFDPFFTTKEDGTGLGLAIASRIVEKHGGLLSYKSELNRGTVFQIALPELRDHASQNIAH